MNPQWVGIGGHRCGSTFLYYCLLKHEDVHGCVNGNGMKKKEVQYYDYNYNNGLEWYKQQFTEPHSGEITTGYLYFPVIPYRLKKDFPDIITFVILRNPVDRAYSHYWRNKRFGVESRSFEKGIKLETRRITLSNQFEQPSYVTRGLYADYLKIWLDLFPDTLVIKFDEFINDKNLYCRELFDRIGVEVHNIDVKSVEESFKNAPGDLKNQYKAKYEPMKSKTRKMLEDFYEYPNEKLEKLCGISW